MTSPCTRIVVAAATCLAINLAGICAGYAQNMGSIDAITAYQVLPAAEMAQDVWSNSATSSVPPGWTRVDNWQYFFAPTQYSKMAQSGFYAAVYRGPNNPNGTANIMIAFRSTNFALATDRGTDVSAALGQTPAQYDYAVKLVQAVQNEYPNATVSLTGHSLGGGLASYAAENVPGIASVTTFNAARPSIVVDSYNRATFGKYNQINVVVPGDLVGDKNFGNMNSGYLPGKTYEVTSTTVNPQNPISTVNPFDYHSLLGIIGGLQNTEKSTAGLQLKPTSNPAPTSAAKPQAASGTGNPVTQQSKDLGKSAAAQPVRQPSVKSTAPTGASRPQQVAAAPARVPARTYAPATVFAGTNAALSAMAAYRPGGISLSKAAAERMSLNIDLEGLHYSNGQVLLAGHRDNNSSIDAALFLTALRTACEATEPYFSLDSDNPRAWQEEGQQATKALWELVKHDYTWNPNVPANRGSNARIPDGLTMRTYSMRRDFANLWAGMAPSYPDLKARLVFRPLWLRETTTSAIRTFPGLIHT